MTAQDSQRPDLAQLEGAAQMAAQATQAAEAKVADLESQLLAARSQLETLKEREMEARRAFVVAREEQAGSISQSA